MAQIFHPSSNTIAKASIFGAILVIGVLFLGVDQVSRSTYVTNADVPRAQPVPFSHEHHVSGLGIDCRYCHTSVEESAFAGMPNTKTCMTCHSQLWTNADLLEPVRKSWRTNTPIEWTRVHDLPDFAHFNHSSHIQKGVGCISCHGQVNEMPLMWQVAPLQMQWCLSCHRDPAPNLRDRKDAFTMSTEHLGEHGAELLKKYGINPPTQITNCSVCHY